MPVYNESKTIGQTILGLESICELIAKPYEILVVESNSTDGTRDLVEELILDIKSGILIKQDSPRGKGNAVREGLSFAQGEIICIYDGDDEYNPLDLVRLIKEFENPNCNFVLGNRHNRNEPMRQMSNHKFRAFLMNKAHFFFTWLINFTFRLSLEDPFTMYKLWRSEIFKNIRFTGNRFDFDWELICMAARLNITPVEIPVDYASRDFSEGKKVTFISDPISWILMLIKCRFRRIV